MHRLTLARPGYHCPGSLPLPNKHENQEGVRCLDAVLASCRCRHTLTPSPCLSPRGVSGPVVQRTSRFATTQRPWFRCRRRLIRKPLFVCPVPEPLLPFLELTSRSDSLRLQRPCTRPRPETPDGKPTVAGRALRRKENPPRQRNFLGINRWIYWGNSCGQVKKPICRKALGGENSLKLLERKIRQGGVDSALFRQFRRLTRDVFDLPLPDRFAAPNAGTPTCGRPERQEPTAHRRPSGINASKWMAGVSSNHPPIFSASMNASCGMSTFPNWRIFLFPAFCFSSSLRLRVASPP